MLRPHRNRLRGLLGAGLALLVTASACGNDTSADRLTVAVAASLEPTFATIARDFSRAHPGITIVLEPGSSTALAARVADGAPFAVLAGADAAKIEALGPARSGPVTVFATNRLAIAVPPGNPEQVRNLADLARLSVIALCDVAAPCGRYADAALAAAGVTVPESHITRAPDAAATLRAVTRGDADAAVVYVTDVEAAGDAATAISIPAAENRVARYGIAVLDRAPDPALAREFVAAVTGRPGQLRLRAAGFGPP